MYPDLEMKGLTFRPRERLLELDEVERRMKQFGAGTWACARFPSTRWSGQMAVPARSPVTSARFTPSAATGCARSRRRSPTARTTIVAVKLGEAYFVIDGHHRAALARRGGGDMIDADVTELIARVPLAAGADMLEVVFPGARADLLEDSGLAEARPAVRVSVSRPAHYLSCWRTSRYTATT